MNSERKVGDMKEIRIRATWYSYHTIEVPDDFDIRTAYLHELPDRALEDITSDVAELIDWEEAR